jgi:hypothetical protein
MGRTTTDVRRRIRTRLRPPLDVTSTMGAAALGCLLLLLPPPEVQGQALERCGVDLRGGVAIPTGDVKDEVGPGWILGAALDCPTRRPWTLRGGVELGRMSNPSLNLIQASALVGGGLSVPVERWPMLLRAQLEGGWTVPRWGGSYDLGRPPRLVLVESGPVLAPGVGLTLVTEDGAHARVDAGARIFFSSWDPEDRSVAWTGPGFDRIVSFVLTVGFRL